MSYRKGYYKKDGTYVQGHFVNKSRKVRKSKGKRKMGCLGIFLLFLGLTIGVSHKVEHYCDYEKGAYTLIPFQTRLKFERNKELHGNRETNNLNILFENSKYQ